LIATSLKAKQKQLRTTMEEQQKLTMDKITSIQEGVHKLEVPVAMNAQNIAALQPR
jgi:hypothetical protein